MKNSYTCLSSKKACTACQNLRNMFRRAVETSFGVVRSQNRETEGNQELGPSGSGIIDTGASKSVIGEKVWVIFLHPSNQNIGNWWSGRVQKPFLSLEIMGPWRVWELFMFLLGKNGLELRRCKDGYHFLYQMPSWDFWERIFWSANQFCECGCGVVMFVWVEIPGVCLRFVWKSWLRLHVNQKVIHALWSLG